jgi:hypothetical protein
MDGGLMASTTSRGACELILDIDYILHWQPSEGAFLFTVSQAVLSIS